MVHNRLLIRYNISRILNNGFLLQWGTTPIVGSIGSGRGTTQTITLPISKYPQIMATARNQGVEYWSWSEVKFADRTNSSFVAYWWNNQTATTTQLSVDYIALCF